MGGRMTTNGPSAARSSGNDNVLTRWLSRKPILIGQRGCSAQALPGGGGGCQNMFSPWVGSWSFILQAALSYRHST